MALLRLPSVTRSVARFSVLQFQPLEMLPQRVSHQRRPIALRPPCRLIGGEQELFVEYDLNGFHMWILLHSILHIPTKARFIHN